MRFADFVTVLIPKMARVLFLCLLVVTMAFEPAFARKRGGDSSGGGNFDAAQLVAPDQAARLASEITVLLPAVFNGLEHDYETMRKMREEGRLDDRMLGERDRVFESAAKKLFSPSTSVFDVLGKVRWNFNTTSSCWSNGLSRDGSAHRGNIVCLSALKTAQKTTSYDVELRLLALAAHEVSHLVVDQANQPALSEREAREVQNRILHLGLGSLQGGEGQLMTWDGWMEKEKRHRYQQADLRRIVRDLVALTNSMTNFCGEALSHLMAADRLTLEWVQLYRGLSPIRFAKLQKLEAAVDRLRRIGDSCRGLDSRLDTREILHTEALRVELSNISSDLEKI